MDAMALRVPIEPGVAVLWTTAFRLMFDWWPSWGGIGLAIALLAVPVRGLGGIGIATIAGISAIPNIWDHYLPTLLVGLAFSLTLLPAWGWKPLHLSPEPVVPRAR
jgi:hypothetical protein